MKLALALIGLAAAAQARSVMSVPGCPNAGLGDMCKIGQDLKWECCPGYVCVIPDGDKTGICEIPTPSCTDNSECGPDLVCDDGSCVSPCAAGCTETCPDGTVPPSGCVVPDVDSLGECFYDFEDCPCTEDCVVACTYGPDKVGTCEVNSDTGASSCFDVPACDECDETGGCAAGFVCDKGSCVLAPPPPPCGGPCDVVDTCPNGDKVLQQCDKALDVCVTLCPCSVLGEGCKVDQDCCPEEGVEGIFCDLKTYTCAAPVLVVEQNADGAGETVASGDAEIADSIVTTDGATDAAGFFSAANTTTGGLTFGPGGQITQGNAFSSGNFFGGLSSRPKPDFVGTTLSNVSNTGTAEGQATSTKTDGRSGSFGSTGVGKEGPAVGGFSTGFSESLAKYGVAGSETKTDSLSALQTPGSAGLAASTSDNKALASGQNAFSKTTGDSQTTVIPGLSASRTYGSSNSGSSFFGR